MIIRQPNTLDIVKIASILFPNSPEDQAECVSVWLQKQQEEQFVDLVAVHKKKTVGFIAGHFEEAHLIIVWMKAETPEILTLLWNKATRTHEFDSAELSTTSPTIFNPLGFKPVVTMMLYTREQTQGTANESQANEPVREIPS
jgi:hypothetical protein